MKVRNSMRSHRCFILQVVTLVVCFQGKLSSEISQGCVGSQLGLECPEMKVISVTSVVLGNSKCWATLTSCCIKDNDCTHGANEQHTTEVHRRCDGKRNCTVAILKEKIPCGYVSWSNNDFERITYDCIDDPGTSIIATTSEPEPTVYRSQVKEKPPEFLTASIIATNSGTEATVYRSQAREKPLEDETTNGIVERVALIAVCTIVLIAIIVLLSIVLVRRKRKQRLKSSATVKTSAGIHGRDSQAAGSGQTPGDGTNELLDSSRNYEPLNFYEQLQ